MEPTGRAPADVASSRPRQGYPRKHSSSANRSFLQVLSVCLWISLAIALLALVLALMALLVLP